MLGDIQINLKLFFFLHFKNDVHGEHCLQLLVPIYRVYVFLSNLLDIGC